MGAALTAVSYATGHEVSSPALADATTWLGTTARNGSAPSVRGRRRNIDAFGH